jgi:hypothetical protein
MNTTRILLAFSAILLTGIHRLPAPIVEEATPTPKPNERKSKPALDAKEHKPAKARAKKAASMTDQELRVVLSENTRMSLIHLRTYVETGEKIPFAPKSDVKPDEVTERLRQVLSNRFRNVSITESSGNRPNEGLVMVFDLQAEVGMTSGQTNSVALTGTFKDGTGRVIDTITASGSTKVPYPAWRTHFPEALAAAFGEFSQKLGSVR